MFYIKVTIKKNYRKTCLIITTRSQKKFFTVIKKITKLNTLAKENQITDSTSMQG